ncbi:MAG: hypothetical protein ACK583_04825 [Cyanobacteriota bacterium]
MTSQPGPGPWIKAPVVGSAPPTDYGVRRLVRSTATIKQTAPPWAGDLPRQEPLMRSKTPFTREGNHGVDQIWCRFHRPNPPPQPPPMAGGWGGATRLRN